MATKWLRCGVLPLQSPERGCIYDKIKPYERISTLLPCALCCVALCCPSHLTRLPQNHRLPDTRPLLLGGCKSNFTCKRLFTQVGWRVLGVSVFKQTSLETCVCLCWLWESLVWAPCCTRALPTKGGEHAHTKVSGDETSYTSMERRCVCVLFHLTEGHQWVILLKSTLGYLSGWQTGSGCPQNQAYWSMFNAT